MIYLDRDGIPTDGISKDYMDSAVRAGILAMCGDKSLDLSLYVLPHGEFIRGPKTVKATNDKNFTRDQMLCLVAGLSTTERGRAAIRRNLYNRLKSWCLSQSVERDLPGSTKYKKRHYFYKDSVPSSVTTFTRKELDEHYIIETKAFDMADVLLPHHIWHMVKASKTYWLYPLALIALPLFLLDLVYHGLNIHKYEENQWMAMATVQGTWAKSLYKMINPAWHKVSLQYWQDRDEVEYHNMLVEEFK